MLEKLIFLKVRNILAELEPISRALRVHYGGLPTSDLVSIGGL